jgi:predicted membrane protein
MQEVSVSRFRSGELLAALILIVLGLLLLAGNLNLLRVDWSTLGPVMLILFGAWLVWRAFQRNPYISGASYGFGDYRPDLAGKEIRNENFSHGLGDFDLDLTRATIPDGPSSVRASHGFGSLKIVVPRDLAVRVKASAGFGDVTVFDQKHEGIGPHIDFQSNGYAAAARKLDLAASVGFGDVKVLRGD